MLVTACAFTFNPKNLSQLAPVAAQRVVEIRTGENLASFQSAMALLHVFLGLPGAAISLLIFKKAFQVCSGGRGLVFDKDNHVASKTLDPAPKVVIALGGITSQKAAFA
jgi:hypothetical protein